MGGFDKWDFRREVEMGKPEMVVYIDEDLADLIPEF